MTKIGHSFFINPDVVLISRQLLGKTLLTKIDGNDITGGIIVETEAYAAPRDRASHAYGNRRTKRTEIMFHEGGVSYVYLCYGIHSLFNIITNIEGIPHAVLIRAIQPVTGIKTMLRRRGKEKLDHSISGGPGSLSKALGINTSHNGISLTGNKIWLEDNNMLRDSEISADPRVGVSYAGSDANLPWRFRIKDNIWTSHA